ncbi:MAG: metallophosphatase family protein [Acidobacteriia bacterium]|nr:metallophosphatase family protein [Terriglobia bacterium]
MEWVVGVISDTHGLLRSQAVKALRGSQLILHAGDIGPGDILRQLARIAPVRAVRGNVDKGEWAQALPLTDVIELGGLHIYALHNLKALDLSPRAAGFAAVISGHSHQPGQVVRNGVLYFNPGSAGPKRFRLPVSVGKLFISAGRIRGEILIP